MDNCSTHRGQKAVERLNAKWPNSFLVRRGSSGRRWRGDERPVSGFGHRRLPALPDEFGRRLQEGNPGASLPVRPSGGCARSLLTWENHLMMIAKTQPQAVV